MTKKDYNIQGINTLLKGTIYIPEENMKGIVEIVHGMAEHRKRYDKFCQFLSNNGYLVYVYDQLGHGETAGALDNVGYMDDKDNLEAMLKDVKIVNEHLNKEFNTNKSLKFYLFGHSMGSFISQRYIELYPNTIDGVILSGTNYTKSALYTMGRLIAKTIMTFKGRKYRSKLLDKLSFGSYNNQIKNPKTNYDWLSVDEENVNKYINDEFCGNLFTVSYFYDFLNLFKKINKNFENIPNELPIYLFSGDSDPVGNMGKGVEKLKNKYLQIGQKDVKLTLYKTYRHEMLNEENYQEVFENVLIWLKEHA